MAGNTRNQPQTRFLFLSVCFDSSVSRPVLYFYPLSSFHPLQTPHHREFGVPISFSFPASLLADRFALLLLSPGLSTCLDPLLFDPNYCPLSCVDFFSSTVLCMRVCVCISFAFF